MQRHYPGAGVLSEKHMALVGLAVCCGRIYAPRVIKVVGIGAVPEPQAAPPPAGQPFVAPEPGPLATDPGAWLNGVQ